MPKRLLAFLIKIDKRQRMVAAVGITLVSQMIMTLYPFGQVIWFIPLMGILVYIATYVALLEDVEHIEFITLFVLPVYFVMVFLLFFYLLPTRWLTRIPYMLVLSIVLYAILLCENIFNVGVEKSLPLYRAAYSVANFMTLLVLFFMFTVIFSFRLHFLLNAFFGGVFAWPLVFQGIWIASPKAVLEERVYKFATIVSVMLSLAILILNFMPIAPSVFAIFTVSIAYALLGIVQETVQDTVFHERIRGYIVVLAVMTVLVFLSAQWS
ncbi:MAG: hypothetical protein WC775_06010 [Patescibacteria group bacterium]|jgi:hypothetical protein